MMGTINDYTLEHILIRIEVYKHFPLGNDLSKFLSSALHRYQNIEDTEIKFNAYKIYFFSIVDFYEVLFNIVPSKPFKYEWKKIKNDLFKLDAKVISKKTKIRIAKEIGQKVTDSFFELYPEIKEKKKRIIYYLGKMVYERLINPDQELLNKTTNSLTKLQQEIIDIQRYENNYLSNNFYLPNKKYTKEMFDYTTLLLADSRYKKKVVYEETLKHFNKELKIESYGKQYSKHIKNGN